MNRSDGVRIRSTWADRKYGPRTIEQRVPAGLRNRHRQRQGMNILSKDGRRTAEGWPLADHQNARVEYVVRDQAAIDAFVKGRAEYEAKPKYRIELTVEIEGYAVWHSDGNPEEDTENDEIAGDFIDQVLDQTYPSGGWPDVRDWGRIEQWYPEPTDDDPRAGRWGEVDYNAIDGRTDFRYEQQEICAAIGPQTVADDLSGAGNPRCKLAHQHRGLHRPDPADGYKHGAAWGDPVEYDWNLRRDWRAAGLGPTTDEWTLRQVA